MYEKVIDAARQPASSHAAVAVDAGRRFQLPPRIEKRTQASTIFTATAKKLTSRVPFRWRAEQVEIFEDWVSFKGANVMSADLVPLLRALDLDGYEDVENQDGESVHDMIIKKVRLKLSRTKSAVATEAETRNEAEKAKQVAVEQVEKTSTQFNRTPRVPLSPPPSPRNQARELRRGDGATINIKPEYDNRPGILFPRPGTVENRSGSENDGHEPAACRVPSIPAFTFRSAPTSTTTTTPTSSTATQKKECSPQGPEPGHKQGPRGVAGRAGRGGGLSTSMDKLKAAMAELSLTIDRLQDDDAEVAALGTAAYDAALEVKHLEKLVGDYYQTH